MTGHGGCQPALPREPGCAAGPRAAWGPQHPRRGFMSCLDGTATPMPAPAGQGVLLSIGFHWDDILPVPPLHWRKETIGSSIISIPTASSFPSHSHPHLHPNLYPNSHPQPHRISTSISIPIPHPNLHPQPHDIPIPIPISIPISIPIPILHPITISIPIPIPIPWGEVGFAHGSAPGNHCHHRCPLMSSLSGVASRSEPQLLRATRG